MAETKDGERRDILVTPVKSDLPLREKAWIDHNRETVERLSSGRIAYIYLSDMNLLGLEQFIRQYYIGAVLVPFQSVICVSCCVSKLYVNTCWARPPSYRFQVRKLRKIRL